MQQDKDQFRQKILMEFFDLVEKPTWEIQLRQIIQKNKMNIWDFDVSLLLKKLSEEQNLKENLKQAALVVLICSILLKTKSRRLGLYELEASIKEELEEIASLESGELENAKELTEAGLQKYNELLELEQKLLRLLGKNSGNARTRKEVLEYIVRIESYFKLKTRLLSALKDDTVMKYSELRIAVETNNSLLLSLLLLHSEDKVKLTQKNPYEDFLIKLIS